MKFPEAVKALHDTNHWMTTDQHVTHQYLLALAQQIEANRLAIQELRQVFERHSHITNGVTSGFLIP